jgi:hypothetical protein
VEKTVEEEGRCPSLEEVKEATGVSLEQAQQAIALGVM